MTGSLTWTMQVSLISMRRLVSWPSKHQMARTMSRVTEDTNVLVSGVMRTPGSPVFRTTVDTTQDSGHSQTSLRRVERIVEELFANVCIYMSIDCDFVNFIKEKKAFGGDTEDRDAAEYSNHPLYCSY